MYVPNYIPDPIEIPNNVTDEPYLVRLGFVKRVAAMHFVSLLVVATIAYGPVELPSTVSWIPLALMVVGLAVVRVLLRRGPREPKVSSWLLLPLLVSVGLALHPVQTAGWPIWTVLLGPGFALIYAILCGRDFSFLGQYLLSLIASSTAIAILLVAAPATVADARFALLANAGYLTYWVYDLASLLARRRLGEEWAGVVDLYRDVLNIFGYIVRCVGHWRKHRIWILPR
ncbi:MAG TPA: Bax inhibitor-1 family protein [Fimbriimonadaceae bacterium]|nr:Bax inhibitor-1 family protein [Fimbriimonadaceae bacterium]